VKAYLDSSVVLRRVFDEPGAIRVWSKWELVMASELLQVEGFRAIDRLRVVNELQDAKVADLMDSFRQHLNGIYAIAIDAAVLRRAAAPFSSVVTTLDAIHIATALLWMEEAAEPLVFVTHDLQQAVAARLAGLEVKTTT
jgi:predicted nucleic acid-binding protein